MFNKIFFQYQVVSRMLAIRSRRSKSIKLLYFKYEQNADENVVTIKFRFSNAVFYKIGNLKTTTRSISILKPETDQKISLTVYGYFRKSGYTITISENDASITRVVQSQAASHKQDDRTDYPHIFLPSA